MSILSLLGSQKLKVPKQHEGCVLDVLGQQSFKKNILTLIYCPFKGFGVFSSSSSSSFLSIIQSLFLRMFLEAMLRLIIRDMTSF